MPAPCAAALAGHLRALLQTLPDARRCWVAYSGGLDSTVLLELAAELRGSLSPVLSAIHIDHGLNPGSAAWARHCEARCADLEVPLVQQRVQVRIQDGQGPEAAARAARYAALADLLEPGDLLLTAHHRDDQAETLLLALLRGAGVRGLAAMPEVAALGAGRLVRPLLPFGRADLLAYARARGLGWVDDPSNLDLDLDRNWLRHRILPLVAERWPAVGRNLARSAGHCAEAAALVDRLAAGEVARLAGQRTGTLSVAALRGLDPPLCRAVLRHWMRGRGLPVPDTRHLARVLDEVLPARPDAAPLVAWSGCEVRRYRDDLFALAPLPPAPVGVDLTWERSPLDLPGGLGRLHLRDAGGRELAPEVLGYGLLRVRFGVAGVHCRPVGGVHHRTLKHLYQEAGVPPWLRGHVPLVFFEGRLMAVGDLWVCGEDSTWSGREVRLEWMGHPLEGTGLLAAQHGGAGHAR
jgi:tRNA(Ile)-lysidine synthase